jgi:hypothetical protein
MLKPGISDDVASLAGGPYDSWSRRAAHATAFRVPPSYLLLSNSPTRRFDLRPVLLGLNHASLLPAALLPLPASIPFPLVFLTCCRGPLQFLQFCAKFRPSQLPVGALRALPLTAHLQSGWPVPQPDRRTCLVDLLPSRPGATYKTLLHLGDVPAERRQTERDLGW